MKLELSRYQLEQIKRTGKIEIVIVDNQPEGEWIEVPDPSGATEPMSGERLTTSVFIPRNKGNDQSYDTERRSGPHS